MPAAPAPERIRLALRAHLAVVAGQLDIATVFVREWRYLEGERQARFLAERRRYEERIRDLFREGVERGDLRTDLDLATAGAALPLGRQLGLHVAAAGRADRRSSPIASPRRSSTACAATPRGAEPTDSSVNAHVFGCDISGTEPGLET